MWKLNVQYSYFQEELLDPRFPKPLLVKLDINILVNADHEHGKVSCQLISGLFATLGSTPISKVIKVPNIGSNFNIWG
jgi:hypothetical protein